MADDDDGMSLDFRAMPKLELHAHLSGSISRKCLHEIWLQKREEEGAEATSLKDPLEVMPEGKFDYDLETFFPLFTTYIYTLLTTPRAIIHSTLSVLHDFSRDGVIYLELRTTPRAIPSANLTEDDYVALILSTISLFESPSSPRPNPSNMKTLLLLSIDRRHTPERALATVDLALKHRSPDEGKSTGVIGIDFCGDPAKGRDAIVRGDFDTAFQLARDSGLKATVHFAEARESSSDEELRTLLSWGPGRLGHVCWVLPPGRERASDDADKTERKRKEKDGKDKQQPTIYETLTSLSIPLEILLSCNISAKMLPPLPPSPSPSPSPSSSSPPTHASYPDHHFAHFHHHATNPLILGTDDVGVFGAPLSREYALAVEHFRLSRQEVLQLVRGAVDAIFAGEEVKRWVRGRLW